MIEDSKGNIWMPALGGTFTRINEATGKTDTFTINPNGNRARTRPMLTKALCTALYEDGKGVLWTGTEEGFAKLDPIAIGIKWKQQSTGCNLVF